MLKGVVIFFFLDSLSHINNFFSSRRILPPLFLPFLHGRKQGTPSVRAFKNSTASSSHGRHFSSPVPKNANCRTSKRRSLSQSKLLTTALQALQSLHVSPALQALHGSPALQALHVFTCMLGSLILTPMIHPDAALPFFSIPTTSLLALLPKIILPCLCHFPKH